MVLAVQETQTKYNGDKRLNKGDNPKIDKINKLVVSAKNGDMEALAELFSEFKPLMLKLCKKWKYYYNDEFNILYDLDDLLQECFIWFSKYTIEKYDPVTYSERGKRATYNSFIKKHMDLRIRYMFQSRIRSEQHVLRFGNDNYGNSDQFEKMLNEQGRCTEFSIYDDAILKATELFENNEHDKACSMVFNSEIFEMLPDNIQQIIIDEVFK